MAGSPPRVLAGLIGSGIQGSLSPAMHEEEARAQGLRLHYQLVDLERNGLGVDSLPMLLDGARGLGFAGLNITYPCKQAVIPWLDELSPQARAMGAVNTVVVRDGRLVGHNTDGTGWRWGFERALPGADLGRVALFGAGGAGSAIATTLLQMGTAELAIVDPDDSRVQQLAAALHPAFPMARISAAADAAAALDGASGMVHATPTGMIQAAPAGVEGRAELPVPAALLRPDLWVSEVVYVPLETELLRTARSLGCRVADGGGMAVGQALGAFELFTGRAADAARVDAHFRRLVAERGAGDSAAGDRG